MYYVEKVTEKMQFRRTATAFGDGGVPKEDPDTGVPVVMDIYKEHH